MRGPLINENKIILLRPVYRTKISVIQVKKNNRKNTFCIKNFFISFY